MITRFAPTPSGYLHVGNAVNALLVSWLARQHDGTVALRIDDMDASRYRREYVEDVFATIDWLGITWHRGPTDPADFEARFSQARRTTTYREALERAIHAGLDAYACVCSRSDLRALPGGIPSGGCPGGCRESGAELRPGTSALRVRVPLGTQVPVGDLLVDLAAEMGDFVIWRRDDLPAYQLASVVEDDELGVTHIVRGEDLLASTAAQVFLAPYLGARRLESAAFLHHGLIRDAAGTKLSKSQLGHGSPLRRDDDLRERIIAWAIGLGAPVGITPPR